MQFVLNSRRSPSGDKNKKLEKMLVAWGVWEEDHDAFVRALTITHVWFDRCGVSLAGFRPNSRSKSALNGNAVFRWMSMNDSASGEGGGGWMH